MQPVGYSAGAPFCKRKLSTNGEICAFIALRACRYSALTSTKTLQGLLSSHKLSLRVDPGLIPQRQGFDLVSQLVAQLLQAPQQ